MIIVDGLVPQSFTAADSRSAQVGTGRQQVGKGRQRVGSRQVGQGDFPCNFAQGLAKPQVRGEPEVRTPALAGSSNWKASIHTVPGGVDSNGFPSACLLRRVRGPHSQV